MTEQNSILEVNNLCTYFLTDDGIIKSVDGVDITMKKGSTLGIVGESGSGKSVTALSIMGLLTGTSGKVVDGKIMLDGNDIVTIDAEARRKLRGSQIAMIFQEPMTSLNPVMKIGRQITETIRLHQKVTKIQAWQQAVEMLKKIDMPRAEQIMEEYPFELSGGQRQRVMIAMAFVCNPKILIADEPTTALDVTIQAQILDLMNHLKNMIGTSIMFITHNLGVVAELCDDVTVMYCGRVVECGDVNSIFDSPLHPYTQGLLDSIPKLGKRVERLTCIPGNVPNPKFMPHGCKFEPRCTRAMDICRRREPPLEGTGGHKCRCWLHSSVEV